MPLSARARTYTRPALAELSPYDPDFVETKINLSANENTYPLPAGVREAIDEAILATPTNRYPDPMANDLRDAIARWYGLERENVCVGNGGDELLFNTFLAFAGDGRKLVDCPPTFAVYNLYSRMVGTKVIRCWRDPATFDVPMADLIQHAQTAEMVVLTSPNNPTGNVCALADIEQLCAACKGVVLVDEAYMEFADEDLSAVPLIKRYPNLIVLKTLSKAFALAGVRVGYVLAQAPLIEALSAVRQPYSIDVFAQATASVVVKMRDAFSPTIATIREERERLSEMLRSIDRIEVFPSQGNFLLVKIPEASIVRRRLANKFSILVRDFSTTHGLEGCLRITVGTPEENDLVAEAFAATLKEVI